MKILAGFRSTSRPWFWLVSCVAWPVILAQDSGSPPSAGLFPRRGGEPQVRVLSWNVHTNSIFPPEGSRRDSFQRVLRAIKPDVICLQEIFLRGEFAALGALLDRCLPLGEGRHWQIHGASDNVIASRYPLKQCAKDLVIPFPLIRDPDFHYGEAMCLVDLPGAPGSRDLYVITLHNKSRGDGRSISYRQRQSDSIVRWIRDLKSPGGAVDVPEGTPFLIVGDLNVLYSEPADPAQHLATLLTGNIIDENEFGPDILPDWDGSWLVEVKPRHNATGKDYYTWRVDDSPFPPGPLDRMIYSDSVLTVQHNFVLNTTTLGRAELEENGLQETDVLLDGQPGNFDHLPLVADFSLKPATTGSNRVVE